MKLSDLKGSIVTLDALGCQQKIASQVVEQRADYVFGLKGNQGATLEAVEAHFSMTPEMRLSNFQEVDKGHGRVETRSY